MINYLKNDSLRELAEEECMKLIRSDDNYVTYDNFVEFFAYLSFLWIENCDLKSAIGFV